MSRFEYRGKVYSLVQLGGLSLDDLIAFEDETADAGRPMSIVDAEKLNPSSAMAMAIGLWAALRAGGNPITFADARRIKLDEIKQLPETQDHKVKAGPKAKKPRAGSGQGARQPGFEKIVSVAS